MGRGVPLFSDLLFSSLFTVPSMVMHKINRLIPRALNEIN